MKELHIRPNYYKVKARDGSDRTFECQEIIEALDLGWNLGSTMKYLWRGGHKENNSKLDDLRKAHFYLTRAIERLSEASP